MTQSSSGKARGSGLRPPRGTGRVGPEQWQDAAYWLIRWAEEATSPTGERRVLQAVVAHTVCDPASSEWMTCTITVGDLARLTHLSIVGVRACMRNLKARQLLLVDVQRGAEGGNCITVCPDPARYPVVPHNNTFSESQSP